MREYRTEVQTFNVDALCECGGKLLPTGVYYPTAPPKVPHKCDKCGEVETLDRVYPYIETRKRPRGRAPFHGPS